MATENITANDEDPGILLDRAKASVELVRFHLEARTFFGEYLRAAEVGRLPKGVVDVCLPGDIDMNVAAIALYDAWDRINTVQKQIEADDHADV